jgi:flagellar basal-body rod modification protein FlgD
MSIPAISSAAASAGASSAAGSSGLSSALGLTQNDFLTLLTTQLQYQNPLEPMSSSDFATQLAQLANVAGTQQMNTTLSSMLQLQSLTQAANLIGKHITYGSGSQGTVSSLQVVNGQPVLIVGGNSVPLSQVQGIG